MNNTIRAGCIALRRRFKKQFRIELFRTNPAISQKRYTPTEEAYEFCMNNLLEEMFDEEGKAVGYYFQHTIAISKERIDLI